MSLSAGLARFYAWYAHCTTHFARSGHPQVPRADARRKGQYGQSRKNPRSRVHNDAVCGVRLAILDRPENIAISVHTHAPASCGCSGARLGVLRCAHRPARWSRAYPHKTFSETILAENKDEILWSEYSEILRPIISFSRIIPEETHKIPLT